MKNIGLFALLVLLVFSSCRKDTNEVTIDPLPLPGPSIENYEPPVESIVGSITGQIINEAGEPVPSAVVSLNNETTTTDDYGHFFINNETLNALGTLVKVEKEGYFEGSRRFFPKAGENNRVKIQLLTKSFDDSFNTSDGGTVTADGGASVTFDANSIRTEAGADYSGTVEVAMKWMDPALVATLDQMPGNLQGINAEVEERALATYGMIAVELQADNGEALNIAAGKTATISMPVPAELLGNAPATIPLWSYNEEHGLWVEESSATLQNGAYVGEVSHFSFWNCDVPMDYVILDLNLVDNNGDPLTNYLVTLTVGGSGEMSSGSGWTDENGNVSGAVPANEDLVLEVIGLCGEVLYTTQIGPYAADASETITATGSTVNSTTISGSLVDCDNNPVTNGLITVETSAGIFYHYTGADFNFSFSTCGSADDVTVTGINLDELESGSPVTAPGNVATDLGTLSTCGNVVTDVLMITVGSQTQAYVAVEVTANSTGTDIAVDFGPTGNDFIYLGFVGVTTGDYANSNYCEGIWDSSVGWELSPVNQIGFENFDVTQYDTKLVGEASGEFADNAGNIVTVVVTFDLTL
ncbi:MAG: carboxypeptidase-like regulatory domain-containing protein [Saprospiraceae bacterium]